MRNSGPGCQSHGGETHLHIVHCREFSTKILERDLIVRIDGTLDVYKEIEKSGYLSFEISSEGVKVRAGQFVGLVPINARLAVLVAPRIPLQNLTRIVTQLGLDLRQVQALRHYGESPTLSSWMMDVLTDAFLHSLEGLRDKGIQRQYIQRRETSSFPRGRIRMSDTARLAAAGQRHRAAVSWFERTPQSPYNQILKAAVWLCLTEYSAPERRYLADNRRRVRLLSSALRIFENVVLPANHEVC